MIIFKNWNKQMFFIEWLFYEKSCNEHNLNIATKHKNIINKYMVFRKLIKLTPKYKSSFTTFALTTY